MSAIHTPPTQQTYKIALVTYGTRGDVQPFVGIARALQERGHTVWVAATEDMHDFITNAGLTYRCLAGNAREFLESREGQELLATGNVTAVARKMVAYTQSIGEALFHDLVSAIQDADVVVGHVVMSDLHTSICDGLDRKYIMVQPFPVIPTREFGSPLIDAVWPFAWLRYVSHMLAQRAFWWATKTGTNWMRTQLKRAHVRQLPWKSYAEQKMPMLHMISPALLPKPAEWNDTQYLAGFIAPDALMRAGWQEQLPAHVHTFLDSCQQKNQKPFFCGFGSMPVLDPVKMLRMLQEALIKTDRYAIVGAGWTRLPEDIQNDPERRYILVGAVDHDVILPQCAGMIHHGGAGTTAAALRAGIPAAVFSVFGDQPFWGRLLQKKNLGRHYRFKKISASLLVDAITHLSDPEVQKNAAEMGHKMRTENQSSTPAQRAALWIEQQIPHTPVPRL